jgi:hypothetical protein
LQQDELTLSWRWEVTSWSIDVLRLLGTVAVVACAARGFVAFASWRRSFRNRFIGAEPYAGAVS